MACLEDASDVEVTKTALDQWMDEFRLLESKLRRVQVQDDENIGEVIEILSLQEKEQALLIAPFNGYYKTMIYLIEHGIYLHHVDVSQDNLIQLPLYSYSNDRSVIFCLLSHLRHYNIGRSDLLQCVVKLVDAGVDVNQVGDINDTPISIAAQLGLYEVVMYMLEHGGDIHYVDCRQNNLIHIFLCRYDGGDIACRREFLLQCIVKLVDAGVDANKLNEDKETPIVIAARKGLCEVVMYLLEHGVDLHYVDSHQDNLMHILLDSANIFNLNVNTGRRDLLLQCVVRLVDADVDVNQLNADKDTPISIAAKEQLYEIVICLLEYGSDVHFHDSHQNNLLHLLLNGYNDFNEDRRDVLLQCVVGLVDAGINVNQVNEDYKDTPLSIAARVGLFDVVSYLFKHGVDVHYVDVFKCNILHYVLAGMYSSCSIDKDKYVQLVNTVINTASNLNQPDYKGNSPLFYVGIMCKTERDMFDYEPLYLGKALAIFAILWAGQFIHVGLQWTLVKIFVKAGCNVNHQNELGRTALMHHIKLVTDISILKLLIPHSDLSLTDNNGDTAISYCIRYHVMSSTIFKLLVNSGTDLMSRDNGVKLFHDILKCKRLAMFSYYIRLKLIVNGVTAEGENMLHLLARVNYDYSLNKFNWLLNSELDVNHPCFKANTPTMIAAFLLNSKYLELLTHHPRLKINTQNNQGHTALHLCIIGFTMIKDGLNKRRVNDVVKNYCKQIYPIYMACIDTLLGVDGIDVNISDNSGRTSLMLAATKNDRVLTRKLLKAGAIVTMLDYSGRSALQYLDIYKSVFDLTCFKLLLSNGNTGLLNSPCIDGNTIIQTALCFPFFWEPCRVTCFIRYLVAENCCLQNLVMSSVESSYKQIDLTELSILDRGKLRKLLYLSGAQGKEIIKTLNFEREDKSYEDNTIRTRGREKFISFCNTISLKSLCRRFIRQNLGVGIQEKIKNFDLPPELNGFLLLKDILHPQDYDLDHIDDGCKYFDDDDDYDGYDIDERDEDYSQYNYQYFTLNTDHELRQHFRNTRSFPCGEYASNYTDFCDYDSGH